MPRYTHSPSSIWCPISNSIQWTAWSHASWKKKRCHPSSSLTFWKPSTTFTRTRPRPTYPKRSRIALEKRSVPSWLTTILSLSRNLLSTRWAMQITNSWLISVTNWHGSHWKKLLTLVRPRRSRKLRWRSRQSLSSGRVTKSRHWRMPLQRVRRRPMHCGEMREVNQTVDLCLCCRQLCRARPGYRCESLGRGKWLFPSRAQSQDRTDSTGKDVWDSYAPRKVTREQSSNQNPDRVNWKTHALSTLQREDESAHAFDFDDGEYKSVIKPPIIETFLFIHRAPQRARESHFEKVLLFIMVELNGWELVLFL